jgi:hypothetical protein
MGKKIAFAEPCLYELISLFWYVEFIVKTEMGGREGGRKEGRKAGGK